MLFYAAAILLPVFVAASSDVLFDISRARTLDSWYETVNLNKAYRFFNESYNRLYVGFDGYLTFDEGYQWVFPHHTSAFSPAIMLAPYWSDIVTSPNTRVYFKETQDSDLLTEAKRAIEGRIFPGCGDSFEPTSLFIATWENVPSYCAWINYDDAFDSYFDRYFDERCTIQYDDSYDLFDYNYYDGVDDSVSYSYPDDYADYFDYYCSDDHNYSDDYADFNDYPDNPDDDCSTDDHAADYYYDYPDYSDDHFYSDDYGHYYSSDNPDDNKRDVNEMDRRPYAPPKLPMLKANRIDVDKNTYQVVLATDGYDTFTIINYEDIQWTSCRYDNKMLFNAGDDVGFYLNPEVQLDGDSNVHQQGRWVYKISDSKIRGPGCQIIGT